MANISQTIKERIGISDLDSVALYARKFATRICHVHYNGHKTALREYATPTLTPTNRINL